MALAQIKLLTGSPVANPVGFMNDALFDGVLQSPTTSDIVVSQANGSRVVFHGTFTVAGTDVTGGTVAGFDVFACSTRVMKGSGFSIPAASFFDALQNFQVDSGPYFAWRLYLPEGWANDPARRAKAGVPEDVVFSTKPEIALDQIRTALSAGVPVGVVLADAGYGVDTAFRSGLTAMRLSYIVGIQSSTSLWSPGMEPLPPRAWSGRGRPPSLVRRDPEHKPVAAKKLAQSLPESAWRSVSWREGTKGPLTSRFAAVRIRPAHRDYWRSAPRPEEWLLIEWPKGESEPAKYWLSNLPQDMALAGLVDMAKLRWRIERDYQELKQEIGLGHYEGRGWRGFHHHATLAIAAYGFLVSSGV